MSSEEGPIRTKGTSKKGDLLIRNLDENIISSGRSPSHLPENESAFYQNPAQQQRRRSRNIGAGISITQEHTYARDSDGNWSEL